jgi:diguanylate cyclase (GGDEF)-like protein
MPMTGTGGMPDLRPFEDFDGAARAVLSFLGERLGLGLWMMTRVEGDDWIVLQADGEAYAIDDGAVLRWADTFCSRMIDGHGPQVAPQADEVTAYADAPIAGRIPIGAYVGVPVQRADGSLFGTLCAIDPSPQAGALCEELPLVSLCARLLGTVLEQELRAVELSRTLEAVRTEASEDSLTGLLNRRGWEERLAVEERRARRYGSPVSVFIIDLDRLKAVNDSEGHQAGDELIRSAGRVLRESLRDSDAIARVGGDEFAVLCMECGESGIAAIADALRVAFDQAGIEASIGWAVRDPRERIQAAVDRADDAMFAAKRAGRG